MKNLKVLFGALSMLTLGAANASTLVLDSFNYDPALDLSVNSGPGNGTSTDTVYSAESFARAQYELNYTATVSGSATTTGNKTFVSEGYLSYGENPNGDGTLNIKYDYLDGTLLDFTGYSDFYFDVLSIDGSGGFDVMLTLEDADGTMISASYNITTEGVFLASFANMMAGADFDFTQVRSANAFISSVGAGDDFSLDSVGLVPAPASLALLGLGLLGLGLRSRKAK